MSEKSESQHTPQNAETRLTFGVELEFILATSLETNPYPHTKDKRQIDQEEFSDEESINYDIFEKLKAVGIPAIVEIDTKRCTDEQYETCWVLKSDATVGEIQRVNDEKWDSRYEKNGMEMSSPPYYYDESAKAAVRMVLRTVRKNYLVRVDSSTGLHVHVGNSYHGLRFPQLRNLLAIAFTYEPLMLLILTADRSSSEWCPALSHSRFVHENPDLTRAQTLEKILAFTDNAELLEGFGQWSCDRLAFNLEGLKTPFADGKRTIEFRHHHGSLDPDAILHWIHVCVKFVERACFAKQEELIARLREDTLKPIGLGDGEISPIDFLMWLHCPDQAYYYGIGLTTEKTAFEKRISDLASQYELYLERIPRNT